MRLLSYNIQYGYGRDGAYRLDRVANVVKSADVAALQEVDRHWQRTGFDDQPDLLAKMLPDHHMVFAAAFDMDAAIPTNKSRRRQFGPMILSRWPILWSRTHLLPLHRMITPLNTQTCALEAVIAAPTGPLRVFSLHLAHVGVQERMAQIDLLLSLPATGGPWSGTDDEPSRNWTESQPEPPCPTSTIWMGDFNMEPGSAFARAYHANLPLTPLEQTLFAPLTAARMLTTLAIASARAARYPDNAPYILRNVPSASAGLRALQGLNLSTLWG